MSGLIVVMVILLVLCQVSGAMMMPLCPRERDGFEEHDLRENFPAGPEQNVHAVEVPRGDGEGRRRTAGFMVGDGASPADADESC